MTGVRIVTEPLGGSSLASAAMKGNLAASWYAHRPTTVDEWRARAAEVQATTPPGWFEDLLPAISPSGAAEQRLTNVAQHSGVVVTSGQQPGLFGGPIYTWSKALTIRALADEIEATTGIPTAPIFWAATDDSDFAEASWTAVNVSGGFERLDSVADGDIQGLSMSAVSLPDPVLALRELERACGSGIDQRPLDVLRRTYRAGATVGSAYLALLRELLAPLGIAVLDASHVTVRAAAHPMLVHALRTADSTQAALSARSEEIRGAGFVPQVADVEDLSLVFQTADGRRTRVPRASAGVVAAEAPAGSLSPNVLLRPVVERAILPTVAYAAGPGEFAYFAQVSAVAQAIGAQQPLPVPRWSVTLVEPHIDALLSKHGLATADVAKGDALAARLLQQAIPPGVGARVAAMHEGLKAHAEDLRRALAEEQDLVSGRTVDAIERALSWRLERFNRRLRSAVRRRDTVLATELGSLGGALYPNGVRQERFLNMIPFLVRYGSQILEQMLEHARVHAQGLVRRDT